MPEKKDPFGWNEKPLTEHCSDCESRTRRGLTGYHWREEWLYSWWVHSFSSSSCGWMVFSIVSASLLLEFVIKSVGVMSGFLATFPRAARCSHHSKLQVAPTS
jgi:hypothetical protein